MRVLICGGGIAGLTAAHFLERDGAEVHVVERTTMSRPVGSMTTPSHPATTAARSASLSPRPSSTTPAICAPSSAWRPTASTSGSSRAATSRSPRCRPTRSR